MNGRHTVSATRLIIGITDLDNMEQTKVCRGCGLELPLEDFYESSTAKDGHRNYCKHCVSARVAKRKHNDPDYQVKHSTKLHTRVANGKGNRSDYTHQYYLANKEKLKAKNRRDYKRRRQAEWAKAEKAQEELPKERLCDSCEKRPCIRGFENLTTLGVGNCRDYKPKAS